MPYSCILPRLAFLLENTFTLDCFWLQLYSTWAMKLSQIPGDNYYTEPLGKGLGNYFTQPLSLHLLLL